MFYHDQDNYAFESQEEPNYNISGNLRYKMYLAWSGNAIEIIKALADQGLETEWDGSDESRIAILPPGGEEEVGPRFQTQGCTRGVGSTPLGHSKFYERRNCVRNVSMCDVNVMSLASTLDNHSTNSARIQPAPSHFWNA